MNLDKLTIEIRPRRAWEAVDLGVLMARRWWWSLTKAWLLVSTPIWLLLCLLPPHLIFLQMLIIWWLKPLFERPLLHILSQAVFDAKPGTVETIKAFPRLAGMQVLASLLWRRFSATRSMDLPVVQLEGLTSKRRQDRLRVLHREDSSPAPWITIFGMHMEMFIVIAIYVLVLMLWPRILEADWSGYILEQKYHWFNLLQNFLVFCAMTLVAPFYVAAGFALYLNRRIRLEAWDLEIAFKNIVQKRQPATRHATVTQALLCTILISTAPPESIAQDMPPPPDIIEESTLDLNRESSRKIIEDIKADEVFHQKKIVNVPDLSWLEFDEEEQTDSNLDFLRTFFGLVAKFGEVILWIVVISLVLFAVYRYRDWLAEVVFDRPMRGRREPPTTLFGLDLSEESLPEDISASACELWNQNRYRESLSLLYRASLLRLIQRGLDIHDGDTEQECLESSQKNRAQLGVNKNCIDYFTALTRLWRQLAYGHILPDEREAKSLCTAWNNVWKPEQSSGR